MMLSTYPSTLLSKELLSLQYNSTSDRFDETWEAPLSTLLGLGRAAGADFIEFFLERVNYISCQAEEDTITSISPDYLQARESEYFAARRIVMLAPTIYHLTD